MTDQTIEDFRFEQVLYALVDVMRRADPEYADSHSVPHTTDEEWDAALSAGEELIEDMEPLRESEQIDLFAGDPYAAQTERLARGHHSIAPRRLDATILRTITSRRF